MFEVEKKSMQNVTLTVSAAMSTIPYISVLCCTDLFLNAERLVMFY